MYSVCYSTNIQYNNFGKLQKEADLRPPKQGASRSHSSGLIAWLGQGTLDPAMFSLMRTDVPTSIPHRDLHQNTCRIRSHSSRGTALRHSDSDCHGSGVDGTLARVSLGDSAAEKMKGSLVTHFLSEGTVGPGVSNRASQTLHTQRQIRLNSYIMGKKERKKANVSHASQGAE